MPCKTGVCEAKRPGRLAGGEAGRLYTRQATAQMGDGVSGHERSQAEDGAPALGLAVALTAVAGFIDAFAFVRFGGLFVSFMSGNSTELAALPSQGRPVQAAAAAGVVVLFVMGAFSGRLIGRAAGAWMRPALLAIVSTLLTLAAVSAVMAGPAPPGAASALGAAAMALAMGAQNSVLTRAGDARATLTYVTGTLVNLGHALADAVMGEPSSWASYLLMWLGLVCGAALGALSAVRLGPVALLFPASAAALLAMWLGALVRRDLAAGRPE